MYSRFSAYLESAEIKTAEYFCILFVMKTAKIYTRRNNTLYGILGKVLFSPVDFND